MLSIDGATKNALQWMCFANILLITWFNWYKFIIIQKIECTYLPYICRSSTEVINQSARVRWKKIHMHHSFIIEPRKSCKQWQWNVDNILSLYGEYVTGHRLLTKTKDSSLVKISQFAMRHFNRITSSLREWDKYMYKQNQQNSSLNS